MTYVMSDIHGNLTAFNEILDKIQFSADDTLYILGDAMDRFPYGIQVLQKIMASPNMYMLLGNHEFMMYDALTEQNPSEREEKLSLWLDYNGGCPTKDSYDGLSEDDQTAILKYIKGLPLNIEIDVSDKQYLLIHGYPASLLNHIDDDYEKQYRCVWNRLDPRTFPKMEQTVIFGHTSTYHYNRILPMAIFMRKNEITDEPEYIGIDCGAYRPDVGRLSCLRLDDLAEFYSDIAYEE